MIDEMDAMEYLLEMEDLTNGIKERLSFKEFNALQDRINEIKKYVRNSRNIIVKPIKENN